MDGSATAPLAPAPAMGAPCTLTQRGSGKHGSASGILRQARAFQITIEMAPAWAFESGDDVILVCGEPGERAAALARFKHAAGANAVFTRLSPWRPIDTRSYVRYRTHARANIRRKTGNLRASVVDISLGGLALEVDQVPGAARLDVRVGTGHAAPFLSCRIVTQRPVGDRVMLHLAFEDLDAQSRTYVEHLVAELCATLEPILLAS
ncbi:MAG: PilZ domain-containing protein [Tepidiformaceae bacterium]